MADSAGAECEILRQDSQGQPVFQRHVGVCQACDCGLRGQHVHAHHHGVSAVRAGEEIPREQVHQVVLSGEHDVQRRLDSLLLFDAAVQFVQQFLGADSPRRTASVEYDSDDELLPQCAVCPE